MNSNIYVNIIDGVKIKWTQLSKEQHDMLIEEEFEEPFFVDYDEIDSFYIGVLQHRESLVNVYGSGEPLIIDKVDIIVVWGMIKEKLNITVRPSSIKTLFYIREY